MPLYRCYNCKSEFEAAAPRCEPCGLDATRNARDAEFVIKLELVHFDPPTAIEGRGKNRAACDPALKVGTGGHRFTGEPGAVTCPKCKGTVEFTQAAGESNGALAMPLTAPGRA